MIKGGAHLWFLSLAIFDKSVTIEWFLFRACLILCSSVFPLWPIWCSWSQLFDMQPIKVAPRHSAYSVIGIPSSSNKFLPTSSRHEMKRVCDLSRLHAPTSLSNSSLWVRITASRTNCGPLSRSSSTCLGIVIISTSSSVVWSSFDMRCLDKDLPFDMILYVARLRQVGLSG